MIIKCLFAMLTGMALAAFAFSQTQAGGIQDKIIEQANKQQHYTGAVALTKVKLGKQCLLTRNRGVSKPEEEDDQVVINPVKALEGSSLRAE